MSCRRAHRHRPFRRSALLGVSVVGLLAAAAVAGAHDFWLVPDPFLVAQGGAIEVLGQTGTHFPRSQSAAAPERVAEARLIGAGGETTITDLSRSGRSLLLRHRPSAAGQYVVAVALQPSRPAREPVANFRRYLEIEGAAAVLRRIEREGLLQGRDSVTRRSVKYAKTLVEVGRRGPRAFARAAGHPLEFVPEQDPMALRLGDTLRLRVLYRGQPLPSVQVHLGVAPPGALRDTTSPLGLREPDAYLTADGRGVVRLPVAAEGLWNVRAAHAVQAGGDSGAWDVHWTTYVFAVGAAQGRAQAGGQSGDSAAVAAVVARYHDALAAGDSASALVLLADDAVILESGGVETREEYRSHHLPGDIGFARAVKSERTPPRVTVKGDVAWAVSTSTTQGETNGRQINSAGAELMVLTRTPQGWRISAIHWSSRQRRPAGG